MTVAAHPAALPAGPTGSFAARFRAGAATANSTPTLGIEVNGGAHPVLATHVHKELRARALVLANQQNRIGHKMD